jgi:hypothetical protein
MGMNTNNLRLSSTSTMQLERMVDDAAWLTYEHLRPRSRIRASAATSSSSFLVCVCFSEYSTVLCVPGISMKTGSK